MSKLYFTRAGAARLQAEKRSLFKELENTQGQKGEAAEVGGNQWHDNFSFEELSRKEQILNRQIRDVNNKINNMVIVEDLNLDTNELRIGHIAVLDVDGERKTVIVGGYGDSDSESDPPTVSYLAELLCQFIGKEQGDVARVRIAGKFKEVTLLDIRLPKKEDKKVDNSS